MLYLNVVTFYVQIDVTSQIARVTKTLKVNFKTCHETAFDQIPSLTLYPFFGVYRL